jgi:hypothetical protein
MINVGDLVECLFPYDMVFTQTKCNEIGIVTKINLKCHGMQILSECYVTTCLTKKHIIMYDNELRNVSGK